MRLRWTVPASQDLYSITRYIRRDNPTAAREVAEAIYEGCESLSTPRIADAKANTPERANWCFLHYRTSRFTA
jgi:plasmid stabilization system protein ParE